MPEAFDQICAEEGREEDQPLSQLLEDASPLQLKEAIEELYPTLTPLQKEQVRIKLTS